MTSEYNDDNHREQAEEILLTFARFTVQFEIVCEAMRMAIMFALRSQGLKNQGMEQVIVGDTVSSELQLLLGALCSHIPGWDDADRLAVKQLLKEVKVLTEERNVVVHSAWRFGDAASEAKLVAVAIRQRTKQNSGAAADVQGVSASYLESLIHRLKACQILLHRLTTCINQPTYRVAPDFARPM
jgi:hypothetical protein